MWGHGDATVRVLAGDGSVNGADIAGEATVCGGRCDRSRGRRTIVEIEWTDGSFTRLAGGSRFTVGGERGTLAAGTAWNAVSALASDYTIATAPAR